jgi:Family of unknown function (DUF6786)
MTRKLFLILLSALFLIIYSCNQTKNINSMGTYGQDKAFMKENNIKFLELSSDDNLSRILIVPAYQGRVMTSTANGEDGRSYGWINYSFIESGKKDPQFNVYGGEERLWIGPEGGPFSIYFKEGDEQVFSNWVVPPLIDTDTYDIQQQDKTNVKFVKEAELINASGNTYKLKIERELSILSRDEISELLKVNIPEDLRMVAYESENTIMNTGLEAWTKDKGLPSIWMLCMFNPSPETTVFLPFDEDAEGTIVNDDYFGKVPSDRLKIDEGVVYFKIDGKYRSKIGIPPQRAKELSGSYDSGSKILTLLWCSLPDEPMAYVNSKWGEQDDPYIGDAINSYNDGPVEDGSIMGPFYEIETSSPAAELEPGKSLTHVQRLMHIEGDEEKLAELVQALFNLSLEDISNKF